MRLIQISHYGVAHVTLGIAAMFMHYTHVTSQLTNYNFGMLKVWMSTKLLSIRHRSTKTKHIPKTILVS